MRGREYDLGLHLLDRQLVDRHGRLCGKVDDLELEELPDGRLVVTAIVSGPGALAVRLRRKRLGPWLKRVHYQLADGHRVDDDPGRIPVGRVTTIGSKITVAADASELPSATLDRWTADHIVAHLPGSRRATE